MCLCVAIISKLAHLLDLGSACSILNVKLIDRQYYSLVRNHKQLVNKLVLSGDLIFSFDLHIQLLTFHSTYSVNILLISLLCTPFAEMEKVGRSCGGAFANFLKLCYFCMRFFKVFLYFFCNFWHFCMILSIFRTYFEWWFFRLKFLPVLFCKFFPSLPLQGPKGRGVADWQRGGPFVFCPTFVIGSYRLLQIFMNYWFLE